MNIDKSSFQEILRGFRPSSRISKINKLKYGYQNAVYLITTQDGENLIIRILSTSSGERNSHKERIVYNILANQEIPVPEILKLDCSKTITPFNYMIMSKISGNTFYDIYPSLNFNEKLKFYSQFGETLASIHSNVFDKFGDLTNIDGPTKVGSVNELSDNSKSLNRGPFMNWKDMFFELVQARIVYLKNSSFEDLVVPVKNYFQRYIYLLDYNITPRLLHMDFHRKNIMIEGDKITGILDAEASIVGHNEFDLILDHLLRGEKLYKNVLLLKQAFVESYTEKVPLDPGYELRIPMYALARKFAHIKALIELGEKYSPLLQQDIKQTREYIIKTVTA